MAKKKNQNQATKKTAQVTKANDLSEGQLANTSIPHVDQTTNPETGEPVGQVTTEPTPGDETTETPSAPTLPEPTEPTPPAEDEPKKKAKIPKVETPAEEVAARTKENVNVGLQPETESVDPDHNQMTPDQAMGWAMTQKEPRAAINRLKRERRLLEVTATFQKLEEAGL